MSLEPGARLGPYEITAAIGAGGMGEVYRARDTRLHRDVAIKVIGAEVAGEPELKARFEREARAVSALNHPNICQIYDVGSENGVDFLVLELLEGESLAARIEKGALPPSDVVRIGAQIADALDRAHRAGIVHRDLKPGNVMLTRQGAKLLDFGLARPAAAPVRGGTPIPGAPSSPTMSRPLTMAGSIVGTFQYMAPEQLEGAEADARSDVWALGATLYEMATGRRAFDGKSQASMIAAILREDPRPIGEIVPLTPPALDRLVRACLAKDPEDRVQTAHDVKLQLQWIGEGGSQAGVPAPVAARRRRREGLAWIVAGVAALVAAFLGARVLLTPKPARETVRFLVEAPPGANSLGWPKISPDGRMLAFQARDSSGATSIWVRPLSSTMAYELSGTQTAGRPFWSADGKELGYITDGKLYRIAAGGGPVQLAGEVTGGSDGSWGASGMVIYDGASGDSIRGIPASGGVVVPVTSFDRSMKESQHAWPSFLPDGKHFLYQAFRTGNVAKNLIRLGTLGSLHSVLVDSAQSRAEFLPPNHIVFVRDGALIARRIDTGSWKAVGEPIVIGENAGTTGNTEAFSVAANGTIAYQSVGSGERLVVSAYDRSGHHLATLSDPGTIFDMAIAPEGKRLALSITDGRTQKRDIWIRDLARGTQTRLTFDPANDIWPVWSPAGDSIAFASDRNGEFKIFVKPVSGLSPETMLPGQPAGNTGPIQWAPGGLLTGQSITPGGTWQSFWLRLADPKQVTPVVKSAFDIQTPRVSPDGKFVTYTSGESGRPEVFVQPFPTATGRWQISDKGGGRPYWTKGGAEIIYRALQGFATAVPVAETPDGSINAGTPQALFSISQTVLSNAFRWMPSPDGSTLYVTESQGASVGQSTPIIVVLDADAELAEKDRK